MLENANELLKILRSFVTFSHMKKYSALLSLFLLFFASCKQIKTYDSFKSMNTYISVQVFSSSMRKGEEACAQVREKILSLEQLLSTTIAESDLYAVNNSSGECVAVHAAFEPLFDFSKMMYEKTGGLFNPALYPIVREWGFTTEDYKIPSDEKISRLLTLTDFSKISIFPSGDKDLPFFLKKQRGMQLDFGAVAKGYAGDEAVKILSEKGIKSALLDLGGNIHALGRKSDGSLWSVGVKCPWQPEEVACGIKVESKSVITSGGYERFFVGEDGKTYIHIFDSRTGRPVEGELESVTIVSEKGMYGDALSTSLFVMGKEEALRFWQENRDFDFVLITKDRSLVYSEGLTDAIKVIYPFETVIVAK